jgi:hypothetical protein
MSYTLTMHKPDLMWVVMDGHLDMRTAEAYFSEVWERLDSCPCPTDMLVDGRLMKNAKFEARRRTEQVIHHPNLGHMAFIVSQTHLLWMAPLARLVSGIGLFGNEHEALAFLETARETPSARKVDLFNMGDVPEHPFAHQQTRAKEPPLPRREPAPASEPVSTNGAAGAVRPSEPARTPASEPVVTPPVTPAVVHTQPAAANRNLIRTVEAMPERPERRRR